MDESKKAGRPRTAFSIRGNDFPDRSTIRGRWRFLADQIDEKTDFPDIASHAIETGHIFPKRLDLLVGRWLKGSPTGPRHGLTPQGPAALALNHRLALVRAAMQLVQNTRTNVDLLSNEAQILLTLAWIDLAEIDLVVSLLKLLPQTTSAAMSRGSISWKIILASECIQRGITKVTTPTWLIVTNKYEISKQTTLIYKKKNKSYRDV